MWEKGVHSVTILTYIFSNVAQTKFFFRMSFSASFFPIWFKFELNLLITFLLMGYFIINILEICTNFVIATFYCAFMMQFRSSELKKYGRWMFSKYWVDSAKYLNNFWNNFFWFFYELYSHNYFNFF